MSNFINPSVRRGKRSQTITDLKNLGNFVSHEAEEHHARLYEVRTGSPIRRTWESESDFDVRRDEFDGKPLVEGNVRISPNMAKAELNRFERALRHREPNPDEVERVNTLRAIIGEPPLDFEQHRAEEPMNKLLEIQYAKFNQIDEWKQRKKLAEGYKGRKLLAVIAARDLDARVREAAEARLMELSVSAKE